MFKVLIFLESDLHKMETELNSFKSYDFVHAWTLSNNRLCVILREKIQPGRPKKEAITEE